MKHPFGTPQKTWRPLAALISRLDHLGGAGATIRIHKGLSYSPRMARKPLCGDLVPRVSARSGLRTVYRPLLLASVSAGGSSEMGHRPRAQTSCSSVGRLGTDGKTAGIAEGKAGP